MGAASGTPDGELSPNEACAQQTDKAVQRHNRPPQGVRDLLSDSKQKARHNLTICPSTAAHDLTENYRGWAGSVKQTGPSAQSGEGIDEMGLPQEGN